MIAKHLATLELPKILARLANYCAFSGSSELARTLQPSSNLEEVQRRLEQTTQARAALEDFEQLHVGGVQDLRAMIDLAARQGTLDTSTLLAVRDGLSCCQRLKRTASQCAELYPQVAALIQPIDPLHDLVERIESSIDDAGAVRDNASVTLALLRKQAREVHDKLMQKLQRMTSDSNLSTYLQESLITQRNGRYVIPIKSDFKGRIPGLIHDQSASGLTLFIEPLATLEMNNAWREAQLNEQREVQRILAELSNMVGQNARQLTQNLVWLAKLDLVLAKAKYADQLTATPAIVQPARIQHHLHLRQARHPLLDQKQVVPIDVICEPSVRMIVITGPNTGGKTVALKTVGLLSLMTQCGLHVPAKEARLPLLQQVYADIGDEQSIEQSLSTFSSHLTNLVSFLERVDGESLVLLDEVGSGTDPVEGAALAQAILQHLNAHGAIAVVATHYAALKTWAFTTPGVVNASMAFDQETLRPLYTLQVGLPGRSNAFAIAERLRLSPDILQQAGGLLDKNTLETETLLTEIGKLYEKAKAAEQSAEREKQKAKTQVQKLQEELNTLETQKEAIVQAAQEQLDAQTETLAAEVRKLRARVLAAGAEMSTVKQIEQELAQFQKRKTDDMRQARKKIMPTLPSGAGIEQTIANTSNPWKIGDVVRMKASNSIGEIVALHGNQAEIQIGRMRVRASFKQFERSQQKLQSPSGERFIAAQNSSQSIKTSPGLQLDLRGLSMEQAEQAFTAYMERVAHASLPFVRIVHGKGTGVLRQGIQRLLRDHPLVASFEFGGDHEGGDGVTVATLLEE